MKKNTECTELMLLLTLKQKTWVREKAKAEGLTMNGFLKNLINREISKDENLQAIS